MNDKKKIALSVVIAMIGVIAFFAVITGLTYAYFTANITGNQNASSIQVLTARLATVQFTDSAQISAGNMLPGTSVTKTFSVAMNGQNTINISYKVYLYWKNSGITDMVYTLTGGGTPSSIKAINTVQSTYKKDEIATGTFNANTSATHNYTLTLTFRETGVNQNAQQGKTFAAYLQVEFSVNGTQICYDAQNINGYNCTVPSDYIAYNYLQSSGSQYINTGFSPNQNTSVEAKFQLISGSGAIFGASGDNFAGNFNIHYNGSYFTSAYNNSSTYLNPGDFLTHTVLKKKNLTYFDNVLKITHTVSTFQTNNNLFIFTRNISGTPTYTSTIKIYYIRIWDNDELIMNLLPATHNGTAGLYNTLNGQFLTNVGSGTFNVGN